MISYVLDISSIHMRFNDNIIHIFVDINECDPNPYIFLFDCEDRINGYRCNLIEWKLALMILSFVMVSLIAICILAYIFNNKKYMNIDHSRYVKHTFSYLITLFFIYSVPKLLAETALQDNW